MGKKILIISFTYPPNPGVGGIRIKKFAEYFNKYGFETSILTAKLPYRLEEDTNIVYQTDEELVYNVPTDKKLLNKVFQMIYNIKFLESFFRNLKYYLTFPDKYKWWYKYAYPKAEEIFNKEKFEIVISSSIPVVAHFVASKLKKKYSFYWIAEYRDLWTNNHYFPTDFIYTFFSKRLERNILKHCDLFVTVSQPLKDNLAKIHKYKPISVITNGFEPSERINTKLTELFTITYSGILYEGRRDPTLLFKVIKKLINENKIDVKNIKIMFYGPKSDWLNRLIEKYSLQNISGQFGIVDRSEILKIQASSQLLLLLMYDHPKEKGVYTAKVFEYLNARRPILAIGSKYSVIDNLLTETNTGFISNKEEGIKEYLLKTYKQYIEAGAVKYHGKQDKINQYSFDKIIQKYISILPS